MSLRNTKITSEIIQTCNRFLSSKHDMPAKARPAVSLSVEQEQCELRQPFRYKITNVERPHELPEISFPKEEITQFSELQPSAKPLFRFEYNQTKWIERPEDRSPFPESIKALRSETQIFSDRQKAEEKILKTKGLNFVPLARNYSIGTERTYGGKDPSENNSKGRCIKNKLKKNCTAAQPRKNCSIVNEDCPRHKLHDCEQSKGSNCKLNYLDPNCTKKTAPYPSYSELCAEDLVEDPSECTQCPWRICDGADTIEPQQQSKNKRRFSTSARHMADTAGVVVGPRVDNVVPLICDVRKPPCKHPPTSCEVRRQLEEEQKRREEEKKDGNNDRRRKGEENDGQKKAVQINPFLVQPVTGDWSFMGEIEDALILSGNQKKKKHPNCHKYRPGKRPTENKIPTELEASEKKPPKGNEGHPPPCEERKPTTKICPQEKMKKPKYKKRSLKEGYYKKKEEPYNVEE